MKDSAKLKGVFSVILVSAVVLLLEHHVAVDRTFWDLGWRYRRELHLAPTVKPVTIVMLDDAVISGRSDRNPYPRDILTSVLSETRAARPNRVLLDIFLTDDYEEGRDGQLRDAIQASGNVYLAQPLNPPIDGEVFAGEIPAEFKDAAEGYGVSAFAEESGDVREYEPEFHLQDGVTPHLVSAVRDGKEQGRESQLIDYGFQPEQALHFVSAYDLIHPEDSGLDLGSDVAAGGPIVVGPYDAYSGDVFNTPISEWHGGVVRGSALLALSLLTSSEARPPVEPSEVWSYILAACCYALAWGACLYIDGKRSSLTLLIPGLSIALFLLCGLVCRFWWTGFTLALLVAAAMLMFRFLGGTGEISKSRRVLEQTWRWMVVVAILIFVPSAVAISAVLLPVSLLIAAWILGWEGAEVYLLKQELSALGREAGDRKVEPKDVPPHGGPLPVVTQLSDKV